MKKILITGCAGFIGYHLAAKLCARDDFVIGCDNFNEYYDPAIKRARAAQLPIEVIDCDIRDLPTLSALIQTHGISHIIHLAAQAGVRYSLENPQAYSDCNLDGFLQILELCRAFPHIKLTFASSSSVYGLNQVRPFSEAQATDHPSNLYGATKKCAELMAHAYHHLYGISITALRFFTVYGPWGRPDMAYFSFAQAIENEKTIPLFNQGKMERDFTYIDDIVLGILAAIDLEAPFEIINLGNNRPEPLMHLIHCLESALGKKARLELLPMQKGEVKATWADITKAKTLLNFTPKTSLQTGINHFVNWYQKAVIN